MSAPENKTPWANIRHDLRTPINHIIGYSELLEEDLADQGVSGNQDLKKIQGAARQLLELIGDRLSDANLSSIATLGLPLDKLPEAVTPVTVAQAETTQEQHLLARIPGHILVVDDNEENRTVLARRLERQGHTTAQAVNGREALEMVAATHFDLVLLDVIMPEVDGYTTLQRMKGNAELRHIPVIMISALDEIASVVRCIEAGAEDYLPKPFNPTILRARIGAGLEKKKLRDQEQAYLAQIEETQKRLEDELQEAARYVVSILPPPMEEPFRIAWAYDPSTELGGDSFGYHWIDDTHFAIYLLDVCGHGVGAALLSVAAINVIRSGSLPKTNFLDPGEVLVGLNDAFQMERHNNMYFTIWYGVYNTADRTLRHASGGHPPAILLRTDGQMDQLRCPGMLIGAMPGMPYDSETITVPPGARLFVYCDGAYEIKRPDGTMIDFDHDFLGFLAKNGHSKTLPDEVLAWIRTIHTGEALDDDYSFVAVDFPA